MLRRITQRLLPWRPTLQVNDLRSLTSESTQQPQNPRDDTLPLDAPITDASNSHPIEAQAVNGETASTETTDFIGEVVSREAITTEGTESETAVDLSESGRTEDAKTEKKGEGNSETGHGPIRSFPRDTDVRRNLKGPRYKRDYNEQTRTSQVLSKLRKERFAQIDARTPTTPRESKSGLIVQSVVHLAIDVVCSRREAPDVWSASNWRMVESLYRRDGEKWGMEEMRIAWKRTVHAHLQDDTAQLRETAACSLRNGRSFLKDLMNDTVFKLKKADWIMTPKQARDIGWAAGKQWFLDHRLVEAIQTGLLRGIEKQQLSLVQAVPVAWAISNSGEYPERLFKYFTENGDQIRSVFNLQHCTNAIWSMAVCGYHPGDDFLRSIGELAAEHIESDSGVVIPQAVADLIWSLGRLNLTSNNERIVHHATRWAFEHLADFSPEELLTMGMGLAMMESIGHEDMRIISSAFYRTSKESMLDVYIDQYVALTLLFPREQRSELYETAFGAGPATAIMTEHRDRQARIAVMMKHNKFLKLISRQLDKVASGRYEVGYLTDDGNLALEILVRGDSEDYSVIPVYPMSRSRNNSEIELGEVRIARRLIEVQGIKFGGFLEWITPDETTPEDDNDQQQSSVQQ